MLGRGLKYLFPAYARARVLFSIGLKFGSELCFAVVSKALHIVWLAMDLDKRIGE